jgi:hypothetical protein
MITFDSYKLDQVIDDRIEQALNFGSVYGGDLFDDEGKVRNRDYIKIGFEPGHVIDILQYQQQQIADLEDRLDKLYNIVDKELLLIIGRDRE